MRIEQVDAVRRIRVGRREVKQLLDVVPEIEWLRAPKPDFDLLDFDEPIDS